MAFIQAVFAIVFLYGVSAQNGCTAPAFLTGTTGIIASANPYGNYQKCRWTITVTAGKTIELSFPNRFDIEYNQGCRHDHLTIYDTASVAQVTKNNVCSPASLALSAKTGAVCGITKPQPIVSTGNQVIVEFCSDSSVNGKGFDINYKEAAISATTVVTTSTTTVVPDTTTTVVPDTTTTVVPDTTTTVVPDTTTTVVPDTTTTVVPDTTTTVVTTTTTTVVPDTTTTVVTTTTTTVVPDTITPISDSSVCGETVVVDKSHTVSYWNANEMPSFMNCNYRYTSKNGKPLKVTATRFELEGVMGCRYDSLKIYDGMNAQAKLMGSFCGSNGPKNVKSGLNGIYMTLQTDEYVNGKGMTLTIEESCTGTHVCTAKTAGNDVCYSDNQICDGTSQCSDGQDESFCAEDCGLFISMTTGELFPGAAAITSVSGAIHCGGALINKQYVLTTAHCFHRLDNKPERWVVKLGNAKLADAYTAQIQSIRIHPAFNPINLANNLALVKIASVPIQRTIAPFCVPTSADTFATGTVCFTLGWGRTSANNISSYATTAKVFKATILDNTSSRCRFSGSPVIVNDNSICATTSGALCFGDNGAPLACRNASNGKWFITGINSIAYGCTSPSASAIFTKTAAFEQWIANQSMLMN